MVILPLRDGHDDIFYLLPSSRAREGNLHSNVAGPDGSPRERDIVEITSSGANHRAGTAAARARMGETSSLLA